LAKKNNPPMTTHRTEQEEVSVIQEEVSVIQEEVSVLWNIATTDIGILQIPLEIRRKVFQICKDTDTEYYTEVHLHCF
jgi:hypothetical protein